MEKLIVFCNENHKGTLSHILGAHKVKYFKPFLVLSLITLTDNENQKSSTSKY